MDGRSEVANNETQYIRKFQIEVTELKNTVTEKYTTGVQRHIR